MQPLRIAIDGRELEGKPTGMGRYLANLLRSWLDDDGDEQFIVYHRHPLAVTFRESPRLSFRQLPNGLLPLGVYWQQVVLRNALNRLEVVVGYGGVALILPLDDLARGRGRARFFLFLCRGGCRSFVSRRLSIRCAAGEHE